MDRVTERLLQELEASPTDLARLVRAVLHRHPGVLGISAEAIGRWERDDPRSWSLVREWLTSMGVRVAVTGSPRA